MSADLLDVNVLIALAWPHHVSHPAAIEWFAGQNKRAFATCPLTETGFVRISLNPGIVSEILEPGAVLHTLNAIRALQEFEFWPDDLPVPEALKLFGPVMGHRQVSDAYLLALAVAHGGRLVTFDRGIRELCPKNLASHLLLIE